MNPAYSKHPYAQPRPTVARIVFALTLASAIAVGLYLWVGRKDPVPPWITLPENAALTQSKVNPGETAFPGSIEYYLQVVVPGTDVKAALENFSAGIERVEWQPIRKMNNDDVFIRMGYPAWIRDRMVANLPIEGAWRLQSTSGEQIDLFAWPGESGKCFIELVLKTGGLSESVDENPDLDSEE